MAITHADAHQPIARLDAHAELVELLDAHVREAVRREGIDPQAVVGELVARVSDFGPLQPCPAGTGCTSSSRASPAASRRSSPQFILLPSLQLFTDGAADPVTGRVRVTTIRQPLAV